MRTLHLLISLFLLPVAASLIFCTELVQAESAPGSTANEKKEKVVVGKGIDVQFPRIFFETPTFNFQKVYKGQKVEHIFRFVNQGTADLEINQVKTSCGCTAAIVSDKTIPPGKTGEIKTTFNTGSFSGKVTKSITVRSNDQENPKYRLTISGEVAEMISISPRRINFGSVYVGAQAHKTVTVTSDSHFIIKKITPSAPFFQTTINDESEDRYTINISLKENHKIGRISGAITLETDNELQPKVTIPLFGEITGDITTYPERVYFGNVKKGDKRSQKVFVKLNKENIEISGVNVTPDYLSARIIENYKKSKSQFLIEVKLHDNAAVGKLNGLLEINTNSKTQPVITVPISGEVT